MKRWNRSSWRPCRPGDVRGPRHPHGQRAPRLRNRHRRRERGAIVVYGGIHATLYPEEAQSLGGAHAVVKGDGDQIWPVVLDDAAAGRCSRSTRRDASTPTSSWRRGGICSPRAATCGDRCRRSAAAPSTARSARSGVPTARNRASAASTRSSARSWSSAAAGFRFVALADDNFYPVTLSDLAMAERQGNTARLEQLQALRAERFELMDRLAQLPSDMMFFTQITMEAAEDDAFLDAMRRANIKGALVGVEAVTPEGLKDVYKGFNHSGEALVTRLRMFRERGVHVLGSFIFGLPSDRPSTFEATADIADRAGLTFAQFVMLTPYPGTVDFAAWEKSSGTMPRRSGASRSRATG